MDSHNLPVEENENPSSTDSEVPADSGSSELKEAQANQVPEQNTSDMTMTDPETMQDTVALAPDYEVAELVVDLSEEDFAHESHEDEKEFDTQQIEEAEPNETGLKRGDLLEGTIIKTLPTEVLVDLGEHGEGVINSRELERLTRATLQTIQVGTKALVYVLSSNRNEKPVLSISRALEEADWRLAEQYLESKEVYQGKVAGYNKGGLIVRFGRLRGFVPASQISQERRDRTAGGSPEERWGTMLGETIDVKVVELKRSRNRLILSEQAATREIRERQKSRLLDELRVGEHRKGYVTSLTEFGAFVDLGGADGLVHLTELSWKHITHPSEVLEVGQEVEVEVISIDRSDRRIGLSIRRLEHDPWKMVEDQYVKGQLIQATITKLTKFGAFARLVDHPEIEGLIHVSELSEHRVRHPREVVSKGDVLTLRIIKIDRDQRRLGLSLKQVDSPEYMDIDWKLTDSGSK
jgi:small subunit ribosomal protein S1